MSHLQHQSDYVQRPPALQKPGYQDAEQEQKIKFFNTVKNGLQVHLCATFVFLQPLNQLRTSGL